MKNNCVFCAIEAGEIPSFKIYEDDRVLAFLDINPFSKGHKLVIPKVHCEGLLDADEDVLAALVLRVKKVAGRLKAALGCDGFNILQNNGEAAGQPVRHIDFHIVPRYCDQPIVFECHERDMAELAALAESLRQAFAAD